MRLGAFVLATCTALLPVVASAQITQSYLGRNYTPPDTVIRPAPMDGWRNYVTVPDGPCGYPMAVQADCYTGCGACCCGPLVFLHRAKMAILNCLLPCNMCCRGGCGGGGCGGGGCGPAHGCLLGGRTWGHCGVCCGGPVGYGGGGCGAPAFGGHCCGCGGGMPAGGDVLMEDSLPQPVPTPTRSPAAAPKPTSLPMPEVRRRPTNRTQPANFEQSHYEQPPPSKSRSRSSNVSSATSDSKQSVLRKASAEDMTEPSPLFIDYPAAKPIVRSQSPETTSNDGIPFNPLRK